jgi:hypothetical protein
MTGSTTRTVRVDTPGRLALATAGNPGSVPPALGRRPGMRSSQTPAARRRRLQGPRRARHGQLSWFPVPGPRPAVLHRIPRPARRLPGRPHRIQGREAGARGRLGCPPGSGLGALGRPRGSRGAWRLLPGRACRESRRYGMEARGRLCLAGQCGARRPGPRPGPGVFRAGHPCPTREPGRRWPGLLYRARWALLGGGGRQGQRRGFPAGPARRAGGRRGSREFRAGPARCAGRRQGCHPGRAGLGRGRGTGGRGHRGRCPAP